MKHFLAVLVFCCLALPATAFGLPQFCSTRDKVLSELDAKYNEVPAVRGLASNGVVFEVTVAASGTWSVVITDTKGVSCLIWWGTAWEQLPEVSGEPAS